MCTISIDTVCIHHCNWQLFMYCWLCRMYSWFEWNGLLWQFMTHAIWHKMSSTMALWVSKEPHRADKWIYDFKTGKFYQFWGQKCKKSNEHIFPLYFWADPFVNLNSNFGNWNFFKSHLMVYFLNQHKKPFVLIYDANMKFSHFHTLK